MEMFDIGIAKREPVEDFHTDPNYLDHIMPYSSDVLDAPADWFTGFVDDRSSVQSMDQLGHVLDYPNVDLDCMSRDQTLNRLNGITLNQRAYHDDFATPTAFSPYATSPVSPDFDHRLEVNSQEIDYDMKSFYSGQQFRAPGINHGDHVVDFNVEMEKVEMLKDEVAVPINLEEDDALRSSGESDQDRDDSESGYDSGAHSPTSETPCTPRSLMLSQVDNDGSSSSTGEVTPPCEQPQNRQPFFLSEEEKRTLITEGLPIPAGYPLTKSEERALKKVRRKIKNKISAQESRRKKKEYMETLEKRVEMCSSENFELRKQLESMETANRSLISQLQKLQAIVASRVTRPTCANSTQTTDEASI